MPSVSATRVHQEAFDVVVVGAGPTGSSTARLLRERGWSVLLLEEHPQVGIPVQCAGLVTPRTFDHTPFPIGDLHQNDLTGGKVFAPNGRAVEFDGKVVHAQAMDRARFDQRMAEHAVMAGVDLRVATKAIGAQRDAEGVTVTLQGPRSATVVADAAGRMPGVTAPPGPWASRAATYEVRAGLLVGADGIRGSVARWFGFPPVEEIVSCYEAELSGCTLPQDRLGIIPMFAGHAQAPGFFSWIIPVGGDRARAGLAVAPGMNTESAKRYYERMFEDPVSAPYLKGAKPTYLIIGGIPLGLRRHVVQDRVVLVGDAAGMAKPTSGGGIYYGLVASHLLAPVADKALRTGRLDRGTLLPYERKVRRVLGRELRKGKALRAVYKRFRDQDFDRLAELLDRPRPRAVIERVGDIDYPSRLVLPLLWAQPRLAGLFIKVLLRGEGPGAGVSVASASGSTPGAHDGQHATAKGEPHGGH